VKSATKTEIGENMLVQSLSVELTKIEQKMKKATTYEEWKKNALEHDEVSGRKEWKNKAKSSDYDYVNIQTRLKEIRSLREAGDDIGLLFALNEGIHGNMGGMGKSVLYERAKFGTKTLIEQYVDELVTSLQHISSLPENEIPFEEKLDFFERASHCFGRSALMLSGAGSLGHFHTGVVKTLLKHGLMPAVISGSSAGSVLAGVLGTHTEQELEELLDKGMMIPGQKSIEEESVGLRRPQVDVNDVHQMLKDMIPDMTFQEAYEKTGRLINVTIAPAEQHQTSRLMNATTSPNVFIRTAVLASCAVPGVFPPVMLMAKNVFGEAQPYLPNRRWVDGAVTDDLPAKRLARLYGVNHYIVSQANPLALMIKKSDEYWFAPTGVKNVVRHAGREVLRSGEKFSRRYLSPWPGVSKAMNMFYSVAAQNYTGDVNITPSFSFVDPQKLLGHLTIKEMEELSGEGERSTWANLEQIRISSKVGKCLDMILDHHSDHDVKRIYKKRKLL
jgi:TAG lipase/steryl ester hydrolase/phospholipase A2/LPA acyltransferase